MRRFDRLGFSSPRSLLHLFRSGMYNVRRSRILIALPSDNGCCGDRDFQHLRSISHSRHPFLISSNGFRTLVETTQILLKRPFHATGACRVREHNYYEILGIAKDASQDEVKKAFHELAKKYHPDANRNNPATKRKFQEIREAYETLHNPKKREHYDQRVFSGQPDRGSYTANNSQTYESARQDPFSSSFYNIFSEIFDNDRERYAPDIQVELSLSFSEAAHGCKKHLSFSAHVVCDSCYGRGYQGKAEMRTCPTCRGSGRVTIFPFTTVCSSCRGVGQVTKDHCMACRGSGVVESTKHVDVTIPAGIDSGDIINVPKAGNSGGRGAHPGNLQIKLNVAKDPIFVRDGADIYVESKISFTQAILGGRVEVPTLNGKTEVKIPRGVQPGQLLVLKGRGLPTHIGLLNHGDQYVRFRIHFPISVNERQRALLEEFAKLDEHLDRSSSAARNLWEHIADHFSERSFLIQITIIILILLFLGRSII